MCGGGRTSYLFPYQLSKKHPSPETKHMQRLKTTVHLSCHQCGGFNPSPSISTTLSPVRYELRPRRLTLDKKAGTNLRGLLPQSVIEETQGGLLFDDDDDDDLCPVECVKEFKTDEEFLKILDKSKDTLVVVDFYRTSCGSCKYIEQGFSKLCKRAGDEDAGVIFLKHNVIDEYDEESEVADRLRIRAVPLFHFYKNGVLLEAFPTRDKEKITEAIRKYSAPSPPPVQHP